MRPFQKSSLNPAHMPTIAVVDDDTRVLESLEQLLESAKYKVRLFASADDFLCANCLTEFDCLISDVSMPGTDGFDLIRRIKQMRPELPVLLISGGHNRIVDAEAEGDTHQVIFKKPFDGCALIIAIEEAIKANRSFN